MEENSLTGTWREVVGAERQKPIASSNEVRVKQIRTLSGLDPTHPQCNYMWVMLPSLAAITVTSQAKVLGGIPNQLTLGVGREWDGGERAECRVKERGRRNGNKLTRTKEPKAKERQRL
ncbi:hypothetical protein Q8A73_007683 [Channa argus]|nr:hypothetical protein Q8A73_007683 [Channa argus]